VTAGNAELAMMALVIIILVLVFAIIWFVFMVPMEKGLHERRMQLIQRRLREKEEQMKRAQREQGRDTGETDDESHG
jgi:F0F1-type ATP synthase membrane subunit b/b'